QQSDVEQLWMSCEMLARQFETGRPSAMMVAEAIKLLDGLGATEGERRRMKIELEAEKESDEDAKDAVVTDIQSRLRSSAGASGRRLLLSGLTGNSLSRRRRTRIATSHRMTLGLSGSRMTTVSGCFLNTLSAGILSPGLR